MYQTIFEALAILLVTLCWFAWNKYVKPWLVSHHLYEAATIAVSAAEAIYGRYNGDQKLEEALEQLRKAGWDVSSASVINAVKAAWQKLNTSQIAAGEKETGTKQVNIH